MKYSLLIKEEANVEIIEAYLNYEEIRLGLGDDFLDHLNSYFTRIISDPNHFPQKRKPYHEAFIKRFPFIVIYENLIIVYSVFNAYKNPKKKPFS